MRRLRYVDYAGPNNGGGTNGSRRVAGGLGIQRSGGSLAFEAFVVFVVEFVDTVGRESDIEVGGGERELELR